MGWSKGDELLSRIVDYIYEAYPDATIFRIHGDDFLIMNRTHVDIEKQEFEKLKWLSDAELSIEMKHVDLKKQEIATLLELENLILN